MPETADNLARDYQITREACDVFAAGSQRKYAAAKADGFFEGEILASRGAGGRAGPVKVAEDEHPRPQTDLAALAKLRPLNEGGVTTAGNASGINDGAGGDDRRQPQGRRRGRGRAVCPRRRQRRRRRSAAHHGHRPGAGVEKGAGPRRAHASPTST